MIHADQIRGRAVSNTEAEVAGPYNCTSSLTYSQTVAAALC